MAVKRKPAATGSKKGEQDSPPVISKIRDYIGIVAGIASIIKIFKEIFSVQ
jgi:hypothetical protein